MLNNSILQMQRQQLVCVSSKIVNLSNFDNNMRIFCRNVLFLDQTIFTEMHNYLSQCFNVQLREQNDYFVRFYLSYLAFVSPNKSDEELEYLGVYDVLEELGDYNSIEYILLGVMTGYLLENQAYQLVSSYERSSDYETR